MDTGKKQRFFQNESMSDPIHILSLGAGVQSSTLALMATKKLILPSPLCGIFADTKDEPESVYKWLDWLEGKLDFPVYRVTKGSLSENVLQIRVTKDGRRYTKTDIPFFTLSAKGKVGKVKNRACTNDFKIIPIIQKIRSLIPKQEFLCWRRKHSGALKQLSLWKAECKRIRALNKKDKGDRPLPMRPVDAWNECQSDALAIQWIGISLDEISRMKDSREPWLKNRWPLIEQRINRHGCHIWMSMYGYPKAPRSACRYCPYHNDDEWRRLKNEEPAEFEKAVQFEKAVRDKSLNILESVPFLHRSCKPLSEVDFESEEDKGQLNMFNNECEGMCGV